MRRGHALIASLELQLHGQLFQLVADHGAVRQPQRQAAPYVVVESEQGQFAAQLLVIALLRQLVSAHCGVERLFVLECPRVDARHHHVVGVAAPVGAGNAAQLEGISGDVFRGIHMGAFAHVEERPLR